jgi:hypothetical protein
MIQIPRESFPIPLGEVKDGVLNSPSPNVFDKRIVFKGKKDLKLPYQAFLCFQHFCVLFYNTN